MQQIGIIGSDSDVAEFGQALARQQALDHMHRQQLQFLLDAVEPEVLGTPGCVLVCDSAEQERAFRPLLDAMGLDYLATRVAAPAPAPKQWTPAMVEAKETAWRAQQPRHASVFTKSQPSTKARKAARKRAKAGRKASR